MVVDLERLINSNNVKYNLLVPMIHEVFAGSSANKINIYIDIYSMTKVLYSSLTDNLNVKNIKLNEYNNLCSCLINMAIHYRSFFRTRFNVESDIYFISSENGPLNNQLLIKDYNKYHISNILVKDTITKYIEYNLDLLKILSPYLPNIYYIRTMFETGVIIYDLLHRTDPLSKRGHLIISKDVYNFQLVSKNTNIAFLRTKPRDGSYMFNINNMLDMYFYERKVKCRSKILNPKLLSLLMAFTSVKERNIRTLLNITTAVKLLELAVTEHRILNDYNYELESIYYSIATTKNFPVSLTEFTSRFKAIDIPFQYILFTQDGEWSTLISNLVDKFDPEMVKQINNEYFITNPLDLNRL